MLARVRLPNGAVIDIYDKSMLEWVLRNIQPQVQAQVQGPVQRETRVEKTANVGVPSVKAEKSGVDVEGLPEFVRDNPWLGILSRGKA
jgi:hypothetical protein